MLVIKNILNKFYIHPFSFIFIIIVILTGMYKDFLILFTLIIVHELGHLLAAKLFSWKVLKIAIYPFGGLVKFDEDLNKSMKEELLILINGPLFQIILFFIFYYFYTKGYLNLRNYLIIKSYHYTLLSFNLLPIFPLDGGKLLNIISNYLFPYKKGNKLVIYLSYFLVIFLLIYTKTTNLFLMSIFLLTEITIYLKNQNYLYNRFLLERYLNNYHFKDTKIINSKDKMYRSRKHIIKLQNRYIKEKDYLKERYNYYEKDS